MARNPTLQIDIDWIERDRRVIDGLDHLGIELVSVNLYQNLLPGLTNVTERARYFSFYPWVVHRYAQEGPSVRTKDAWWNWFRPLDFAYGLACISYESGLAKDLGSSVVGAVKARELVREKPPSGIIDFRGLTAINASGKPVKDGAYFKNPEGGFGQYYKTPLKELGVLQPHTSQVYPAVKLSTYAGLKVAETLDSYQSFKELIRIASEGKATVSDLARIGGDIHPDSIPEDSQEESLLRSLFFGLDVDLCQGQEAEHLKWRRLSLLSMLRYVRDCNELEGTSDYQFRWACLAKALPKGTPWQLPSGLSSIVEAWGAYQRNDLLNYCLESLFFAALNQLDEEALTPRELATLLTEQAVAPVPVTDEFPRLNALPARVSAWVSACGRDVADSRQDRWDESSTWALAIRLESTVKKGEFNVIPALAARLLGRLGADVGSWEFHPFESVPSALEMSAAHEVQLKRWLDRLSTRASEKTVDFLNELILEWILFRHLRVATRKLANQGVSTFKFRPEEGKLLLIAEELPDPTFTSPRLRQGFRILEDLHYVSRTNDVTKLTDAGEEILEVGHA